MVCTHRSVTSVLPLLLCSLLLAACSSKQTGDLAETTVASEVYQPGQPGRISSNVTTVEADVIAVDYKARTVTLQDAQGNKRTLKIPAEAVNFDQVRVGDHFLLQVASEVAVFLLADSSTPISAPRTVDLTAPKGEKPAFLVASTEEIKGVVTAVDMAAHTARVTFDDGRSETFPVRPDIALDQQVIGQGILLRVTEAVALSVTAR